MGSPATVEFQAQEHDKLAAIQNPTLLPRALVYVWVPMFVMRSCRQNTMACQRYLHFRFALQVMEGNVIGRPTFCGRCGTNYFAFECGEMSILCSDKYQQEHPAQDPLLCILRDPGAAQISVEALLGDPTPAAKYGTSVSAVDYHAYLRCPGHLSRYAPQRPGEP